MINHEEITRIVSSQGGYGKGVYPNPYSSRQTEWERRRAFSSERAEISKKIEMLFEPRFITPPETSECIESIITVTDSRRILEVGTHTGFTTLHMLRAIVGKENARIVTVDARPAHDYDFFSKWPQLSHVSGWTPQCLIDPVIIGNSKYDLVFVDSDHSLDHTQKELQALLPITRVGTIFLFHDLPAWQSPENRTPHPARTWIEDSVKYLRGVVVPTCEQLDCVESFGAGYPKELNPHLGIFVRTK